MSTSNHRRGAFGAFAIRVFAFGVIVGGVLIYNKHHNPEQHEKTVTAVSNAKESVVKKAGTIKGKVADKLPADATKDTDRSLWEELTTAPLWFEVY